MGDLMAHAINWSDNVATFMVGPNVGIPLQIRKPRQARSHHQMSHNQGRFINDLLKVDHFHMQQFATLLKDG